VRRPFILAATLLAAGSLAGVGIAAAPGGAHQRDLGGFGGPVHGARPVAIWREGATPSRGTLHRVPCATAALGDTSRCYAP
jgi:hypothetical protein